MVATAIILIDTSYFVAIAMILVSIEIMSNNLNKAHNLAWRKFLTVHITLLEQIEHDLAQADLPPLSWYDVLFTLSEASEHRLRLNELAQAVLLSRSNLTRLVDRLEGEGLIQRERCPNDRRGFFAVITDKGLVVIERMWPVYSKGIKEYFACHIDMKEVKFLIKILNRMIKKTDTYNL